MNTKKKGVTNKNAGLAKKLLTKNVFYFAVRILAM